MCMNFLVKHHLVYHGSDVTRGVQMKRFALLCVLIVMLTIYYFSNIPYLHFVSDAGLPLWLRNFISTTVIKIGTKGFFSYAISMHPDFIIHKLGHISLYGLLGISLYLATKYSMKWSMVISILFAISDEIHQSYVVGRSSRFGDILLDIIAAIGFMLLARKMIQSKRFSRYFC